MYVYYGDITDGLKQKLQDKKVLDVVVTYFEIFYGGPMRHDKLKIVCRVLLFEELKEDEAETSIRSVIYL